jgi:ABC-type Mn2+/Zn2+ transport system ATPase subunit
VTVVVSTHDLADAAACDRVLLVAGRQVAFGSPSEVLVEHNLAEAFGGRVLQTIEGAVVVDDPHHHPEDLHHAPHNHGVLGSGR